MLKKKLEEKVHEGEGSSEGDEEHEDKSAVNKIKGGAEEEQEDDEEDEDETSEPGESTNLFSKMKPIDDALQTIADALGLKTLIGDAVEGISRIANALARGDMVEALDCLVVMTESANLNFFLRVALKCLHIQLLLIHPIYNKIFPSTKDQGDFKENLKSGVAGITKMFPKLPGIPLAPSIPGKPKLPIPNLIKRPKLPGALNHLGPKLPGVPKLP